MIRILGVLFLLLATSTAQELPREAVYWYGVYVRGSKIGWSRLTLGLTEKGELVYEEVVDVKLVDSGVAADTRYVYRYVFDPKPPYALRSGASVTTTNGDTTRNDLVRAGRGFVVTLVSPGGTRKRTVDKIAITFTDMYQPILWARGIRKKGDRLKTPGFDLDELRPMSDTIVIDEVVEEDGRRIYETTVTTEPTGDRSTMRLRDDGVVLSGVASSIFEMRLETEIVAKRARLGVDLFDLGIARVDRKLGDAEQIVELVLEASGAGTRKLVARPHQGWDGKGVLTLGPAHGPAVKATEAEIKDALAEGVLYPIRNKEILDLARKAIGDATTPRDKVKRLVRFVSDYVVDDLPGAEGTSALDVVKLKKGDCTEHALLFTALARAVGVPARPVTGFIYAGDENQGFGGHAWNEVVLDGRWVPVDAAWDEFEPNATHISLGHGRRADAALTEVLGKLKFKVVSLKRK